MRLEDDSGEMRDRTPTQTSPVKKGFQQPCFLRAQETLRLRSLDSPTPAMWSLHRPPQAPQIPSRLQAEAAHPLVLATAACDLSLLPAGRTLQPWHLLPGS